jgi:hypothetical protein
MSASRKYCYWRFIGDDAADIQAIAGPSGKINKNHCVAPYSWLFTFITVNSSDALKGIRGA